MNEALVVILALLWALILLPGAIRDRRTSPRSTVGGFEHAMDVLAHHRGPSGRELMVPRDATRIVTGRAARSGVLARRRRAFATLTGSTGATFLLALLFQGVLWLAFLLSAAALGAFVALLLNLKAQQQQAREVVRELAPQRPVVEDLRVVHEPGYAQAAVGAEPYGGVQVATRPDEPWHASSGVRIRRWDA